MPETHDNTTSTTAKAPRSEAQQAAARRNGANSKGPVSPMGKAISCRNALRHGLTAFTLALTCEDHEAFNLVLADYQLEYRPKTATEHNLVEQIAFAQWQMYRAWTTETAILNVEIETNRPKLAAKFAHFAEAVRVADAMESSLDRTGSLPHINRCLSRINREYFRALNTLRAIRKDAPVPPRRAAKSRKTASKKDGTNPSAISVEVLEDNQSGLSHSAAAAASAAAAPAVNEAKTPVANTVDSAETNPAISQKTQDNQPSEDEQTTLPPVRKTAFGLTVIAGLIALLPLSIHQPGTFQPGPGQNEFSQTASGVAVSGFTRKDAAVAAVLRLKR